LDIIEKTREQLAKTINDTFINCDVRYFNWNLFVDEVGKFDVTIIDPPWRIKGAQQNDSQFMFSNCKFSL
jgi:mRNA (2'-O-methyladenosine-N6-)-methyltransferase